MKIQRLLDCRPVYDNCTLTQVLRVIFITDAETRRAIMQGRIYLNGSQVFDIDKNQTVRRGQWVYVMGQYADNVGCKMFDIV